MLSPLKARRGLESWLKAMVTISLLAEGGAVVTGIVLPIVGRENIASAQAMAYAVS